MGSFRHHNKLWLRQLNNRVMTELANHGLQSACQPKSEIIILNRKLLPRNYKQEIINKKYQEMVSTSGTISISRAAANVPGRRLHMLVDKWRPTCER